MKTYVLDASALMTFFENRPGADKVEELLTDAADASARSRCRWSTGARSITRSGARTERRQPAAKLQEIAQLPIQVFDVDMELAKLAASLKAQYNLPYADSFAAALAQARKSTVVTSDKDFERAGTALKILWV